MARKPKHPAKPIVSAEKYEALEQDFNELTARTMMLKRDLLNHRHMVGKLFATIAKERLKDEIALLGSEYIVTLDIEQGE